MATEEHNDSLISNGRGTDDNDTEDSDGEGLGKLRPVEIELDMREMERRKRVDAIMNSKWFKEELEIVIRDSLADSGFSTLLASGRVRTMDGGGTILINDIRGTIGTGYSQQERMLRCKLAAVYRLIDSFYGWTQSLYHHVTARISQGGEQFLVNPLGLLYKEITASSLAKVDMQGRVLEAGSTNFGTDVPGFLLHAAVYSSRPDIKCIVHVLTPGIVGVSGMKCGLLCLSHDSCLIGDVSYHSYNGMVRERGDREKVARDLGVRNKVMFLRNEGALCCGQTIEEALFYASHLVMACDIQLKMVPVGVENLVIISEPVRQKVFQSGQNIGGAADDSEGRKNRLCGVGEMAFEAQMRMLDNAGLRTGHLYKMQLARETSKPKNDVELPPSASSLGYTTDEENLYKDGTLRSLLLRSLTLTHQGRTRWAGSHNMYQKIEPAESGTSDSKEPSKWVQEGPSSLQLPTKADSSTSQYVPLGTSRKEFKRIQQAMKDGRRAGGVTAGPESRVLDGTTWEEARATNGGGQLSDGHDHIKVGAASKGIIQREYQRDATVFKSAYAKNPFDNVTEEELKEYRRKVDSKARGAGGEAEELLLDPEPTEGNGVVISKQAGKFQPEDDAHAPPSSISVTKNTATTAADKDGGNHGDAAAPKVAMDSPTIAVKEKKKKSGLRTPSFLKKRKPERMQAS